MTDPKFNTRDELIAYVEQYLISRRGMPVMETLATIRRVVAAHSHLED